MPVQIRPLAKNWPNASGDRKSRVKSCRSASAELPGECQRFVRQISREDQVSGARLQRLFRLLNEANCGGVLCPPIRPEAPEIAPTGGGVGASDDSANRSFDLYFCHRRRRL